MHLSLISAAAFILCLITFYFPPAYSEMSILKPQASLRRTFDIVVSIYKEEMSQVAMSVADIRSAAIINCSYSEVRVFIYTKDRDANITNLQETFETKKVFQLENRGREMGSYLSHILKHWDDLAHHTLFMQGQFTAPLKLETDYKII
jgi:hypothetical protein